MTVTNFKALHARFKYNKQTSEDEKLVSPFAKGNDTWLQAFERYIQHHKKAKDEQLDMFTRQGLMFPLSNDDSVIPKQMMRSSLFTPITRGRRKYINEMEVAKFKNGVVSYTGVQLDQADLDVLLAIVQLLSDFSTSGNVAKISEITDEKGRVEYSRIKCSSHSLLKLIGRATGRENHKWLWKSLQRLTGELDVVIKGNHFAGGILGKRAKEAESRELMIDINQDFVKLFSEGEFSFIDMKVRLELKGDFSKWLQAFISTHTGVSSYSAEKLIELSGQSPSRVRQWVQRQAMPAFEQLKQSGLIKYYNKKGHLFTWKR